LTIATVVKDDLDGFRRTAESLRLQDRDGTEWIVIDSSEERVSTVDLARCEPLASAQVAWTEPRGVYPAMNHALKRAKGAYIHYLNAGDTYADESVVSRLVSELAARRPTWAYGQVRFIADGGRSVVPPPFDYRRERDLSFSRGRFPPHQGTIVATETLRSLGGFDPSWRVAADYATALKLSKIADPLEFPWLVADFHEGGLSTVAWRDSLSEFHRARVGILRPAGIAAWRERYEWAAQWSRMATVRGRAMIRGMGR
jgi:hypothetical protein